MAEVHSLNRYSKGKRVYHELWLVTCGGMLIGITTAIINGACGIDINAGHRTSN